mgnify:CR=1 FL=1
MASRKSSHASSNTHARRSGQVFRGMGAHDCIQANILCLPHACSNEHMRTSAKEKTNAGPAHRPKRACIIKSQCVTALPRDHIMCCHVVSDIPFFIHELIRFQTLTFTLSTPSWFILASVCGLLGPSQSAQCGPQKVGHAWGVQSL